MVSLENEKELGILRKFQDIVSDLEQDEMTCIRFLVAREFDISKAERMLRENHKWRREVEIENIYNWTLPDYINKDVYSEFSGRSKNGGPVVWLPMGRWNAKQWLQSGKLDELKQYGYYILENILKRMNQYGDQRTVAILCMKDLTYWKVAHLDSLRVLYSVFQALEQNYPEILQTLIIINAPMVFTIGYNFISPILSQRTVDKIQIHGTDKTKWLPLLRDLCEKDAIPQEYLV